MQFYSFFEKLYICTNIVLSACDFSHCLLLAASIVCVSFSPFLAVSFWFLRATLVERFAALICLA